MRGTSLRRLAVIVALGYAMFLTVAWFATDPIMFQAPKPADYEMNPSLDRLAVPGGERIVVLRQRAVGAPRATVLFAHGNGRDLGDVHGATDRLVGLGFDVVSFDYRGYGHSDGEASEDRTYEDIDAVYRSIRSEGVAADRIVVVGHSLGGGPAAWLAQHRAVRALLLASTFTSANNVVVPPWLLPFDSYETAGRLADTEVPVAIVHGTADEIVDVDNAPGLYAAARAPKRMWLVDGGGHDGIFDPDGLDDLPAVMDWLLDPSP